MHFIGPFIQDFAEDLQFLDTFELTPQDELKLYSLRSSQFIDSFPEVKRHLTLMAEENVKFELETLFDK